MAILLQNVTGVKHDGIRRLHDLLLKLLSTWLRRAKIKHVGGVGGFKHTCKGFFTEFANQLPKLDPNTPPMPRTYGTERASSPILFLTVDRPHRE